MTQAAHNLHITSSRRLQVPPAPRPSLAKRIRVLIIPICLMVGLTLGVITFSKSAPKAGPAKVVMKPEDELKLIQVPLRFIPSGSRIESSDFQNIVVKAGELSPDTILNVATIVGQYARTDLEPRRPILKGDLSQMPTFKTLQAAIPFGNRGITLAVDATGGIEGWSKPGAHVDVIVSYFDKKDGKKKTQSVVEDAVVLSFNGMTTYMLETAQQQDQQQRGAQPVAVPQSATVTLSVPLKDALRIQTAKMLGTLSLLLRNPKDNTPSRKKYATPEDLRKMLPVDKVTAPIVRPIVKKAPPPPVASPDGFAKYRDRQTGEFVELELWGEDWKSSKR